MIIYETIDEFSQNTGVKVGSRKVLSHVICDFTGEKLTDYENPNLYGIDFNGNDPCFGDGEGERWFHGWCKEKFGEDYCSPDYKLFGQRYYVFKHNPDKWEGCEIFQQVMEAALKELDEIYSLDHLLRWSRGKMLEKVIKEGTYSIDDFLDE